MMHFLGGFMHIRGEAALASEHRIHAFGVSPFAGCVNAVANLTEERLQWFVQEIVHLVVCSTFTDPIKWLIQLGIKAKRESLTEVTLAPATTVASSCRKLESPCAAR